MPSADKQIGGRGNPAPTVIHHECYMFEVKSIAALPWTIFLLSAEREVMPGVLPVLASFQDFSYF
jgi:hypothetical protein